LAQIESSYIIDDRYQTESLPRAVSSKDQRARETTHIVLGVCDDTLRLDALHGRACQGISQHRVCNTRTKMHTLLAMDSDIS
jgi:hypothetical protein